MTSPLTDAVLAANRKKGFTDAYLAMAAHAERLEEDRAAPMEAVERIDPYPFEEIGERVHGGEVYCEISVGEMRAIRAALSQARANFP